MTSGEVPVPVVPENLRPGQLGVVMLGRVIMGDIAVTLVDLCVRDLIRVEKVPGSDAGSDWLLRPRLASAPQHWRTSLLGYEETLLKGLSHQGETCHLSSLPGQARLLDATRSAVVRDSVHHGWLRHLDHQKRTGEGEELARKIRGFQRQLRHFTSGQGSRAVPDKLLPYALHFGYMARDDAPLVQFAHAWVEAFADLPGWRAPEPKHPEFDQVQGPLLTNDDSMSKDLASAAFLLGM
jgi:hypothetical protein